MCPDTLVYYIETAKDISLFISLIYPLLYFSHTSYNFDILTGRGRNTDGLGILNFQ